VFVLVYFLHNEALNWGFLVAHPQFPFHIRTKEQEVVHVRQVFTAGNTQDWRLFQRFIWTGCDARRKLKSFFFFFPNVLINFLSKSISRNAILSILMTGMSLLPKLYIIMSALSMRKWKI